MTGAAFGFGKVMKQHRFKRFSSGVARFFIVGAVLILFSPGAEAGPRRARLSRDLLDRLASGRTDTAAVIISGNPSRIQAIAQRYGGRITKQLRGAAVVEFAGDRLDAVSQDPDVDHLSGDVPVRRLMTVTSEAIGADQVWRGAAAGLEGYTGRGIGVAVIDSGIANHKSVRKQIVASVDFTAEHGPATDEFGHGTHVAGIIAGSNDSEYAGVAPGAHIVSLKVLKADGSGDTSNVIAAIDWTIEHRAEYGIRIINLSLGHPVFESYRDDPLCQAVQRAVDAGMVVVAAGGNFGKTEDGRRVVGGIVSPGNSPAALTVGALNTRGTAGRGDDVMATYSSRGPTAIDGLLKPELVAPGNRLVSAAAAGAYLTTTYPERLVSGQGASTFIEMSGTSMAAAVVSGTAALVLDANPALTPAEVKLALQVTSSRVAGAGLIEAGAGSVNAVAAVDLVTGSGLLVLPNTTIAGQTISSSGITYVEADLVRFCPTLNANILVWGNRATAIEAATIDTADSLVWGNILVWGNQTEGDILVWGNMSDVSDILVWGNRSVWSVRTADGDILVWGNTTAGDILVWGNFVEADSLVWGNSAFEGDILVWGN